MFPASKLEKTMSVAQVEIKFLLHGPTHDANFARNACIRTPMIIATAVESRLSSSKELVGERKLLLFQITP